MQKYLFENENLKAKVLYDFKDFVMEILEDPEATLDGNYYSYQKHARRIGKLAADEGILQGMELDYSKNKILSYESEAEHWGNYRIEHMASFLGDYNLHPNELLAFTMVWTVREQLFDIVEMGTEPIIKSLDKIKKDVMERIILNHKNARNPRKNLFPVVYPSVNESDDSYFGDSELDNADYPNGILHQRFDRHGKWQKRSIDDWSGRVGWAKKKDFYSNAKAAFEEFLDLAIDIPSLLGSLDKTVEMENGNSKSRTKLSELLTVGLNSSDRPFWYFTPQVGMETEAINQCSKNIRSRIFAAISRNYKPVLGEVKEFIRNADSAEDVYVLDDNGIPVRITQKFFKLLKQCISTSVRGLAKDLTEILKDEE